jgi:hypothetical protein
MLAAVVGMVKGKMPREAFPSSRNRACRFGVRKAAWKTSAAPQQASQFHHDAGREFAVKLV